MVLELSSFKKALDALERSLQATVWSSRFDSFSALEQETLKSGVVQNFEVAYEQTWKMLKRWLENNVNPGLVDGISRRELFRHAAEHLLIQDVDVWMAFHQARNLSSHTYDADSAASSFQSATEFLPYAQAVLRYLESHND